MFSEKKKKKKNFFDFLLIILFSLWIKIMFLTPLADIFYNFSFLLNLI